MKYTEIFFIFREVDGVLEYLTHHKHLWSPDIYEAEIMSEKQASDECGEYEGGRIGSAMIKYAVVE